MYLELDHLKKHFDGREVVRDLSLTLEPVSYTHLAFMALPEVFSRLPGGVFFGFAFFLLLFVAALTSAISILESLSLIHISGHAREHFRTHLWPG